MKKLILALQQRFGEQKLARKPEMDIVMFDREQDEQFSRDGEDGSLAILYDFIINAILKIVPSSGKALDLCCGSGQLLCKLAKALPGLQFTGLDLSPHMLTFARANAEKYRTPNVSLQAGSMYEITNIFHERFDLITWHLALHHCDGDDDVVRVLDQIASLLKEDGTLFIFDICRPKTGRLALQMADMYNHRWGEWFYHDSLDSYKAAFTFDELERLLKRSKLKNYGHIQPVIGNIFQIVYKTSTSNKDAPAVANLKHLWQKADHAFLKFIFRLPFA